MELLEQHVDYIERLYRWIDSLGHTKTSNGVFYLLERFHLNHRHAFGNSSDLRILEQRLAQLHARCVLLTLSADVVESRYIESRGHDWKAYVMKDGLSVAEACRQFLDSQDSLRQWAAHSLIPVTEITTDDADWHGYAEQILQSLVE